MTLTEAASSGSSTYTASINVVGASADANAVCGQVNNTAEYVPGNDTQYAPTFINTVLSANVAEAPLASVLLGAGVVAALLEGGRRSRRRSLPRE